MKHSSPVVAGPRLPQRETKPSGPSEPGVLKTDPWAQYKSSQSSSQGTIAQPMPTGTVQQKLQVQDDKIANIADELNKLKSSHQQLGQDMQHRVEQLQASLDTSEASFTKQLGQVKTDLESSFQTALQAQQQSIVSGFQELKNMFQQTQEAKGVRRSHLQMESDNDANM